MSSRQRRWQLCGGIGSGKSEVRRLLVGMGVKAVDADSVGHLVLEAEALPAVAARWPDAVVGGHIDRRRLGSIVFDDPGQLAELEAITHPYIFGRIRSELEGFDGVAVVEVPVLNTGLGWPRMVVDAENEVRLERAMARGMDRLEVARRMRSQPSRAEWLSAADVVIPNHGTLEELEDTVNRLLDGLRAIRDYLGGYSGGGNESAST